MDERDGATALSNSVLIRKRPSGAIASEVVSFTVFRPSSRTPFSCSPFKSIWLNNTWSAAEPVNPPAPEKTALRVSHWIRVGMHMEIETETGADPSHIITTPVADVRIERAQTTNPDPH